MTHAAQLLLGACGFLATTASTVTIAAPPKGNTEHSLQVALESPLVGTWSGTTLRDTLARIAQSQQIAIWLDRRVDPGQLVEYAATDVPLGTALHELGGKYRCGISVVGSVVYVGPIRPTTQLATLAAVKRAEVSKQPAPRARELLAERAWSWPERSQPRELIAQLLREGDVVADNLEAAVPHDLWPALALPPLAWADRLTLVLAGFGLTYQFADDGQSLVLLPWPDTLTYTASYPITGDAKALVIQLQPRFPDVQFRATAGHVQVTGRYEDHELIRQRLTGQRPVRPPKADQGSKTFDLNVEKQPLGPAVRAIAERIGAKVELAPALEQQLNRPLTFRVEKASFDELWRELAKAAGLKATIEGNRVRLDPAGP